MTGGTQAAVGRLLGRIRRVLANRGHPRHVRTVWPSGGPDSRGRVGIVVVNFNTARLISQLVFSLYRLLGKEQFAELVVVDNASTDGSAELLSALHEAGLIHLIRNSEQRYHGPALTQGVSWLAERQSSVSDTEQLDYVWVLDSDVVVLRDDVVGDSLKALRDAGAVAVGQLDVAISPEDMLVSTPLLHVCSLLFDPAVVWQPQLPPFLESGLPSRELQASAERLGLRMNGFPFVDDGYIVHLGRGTLRAIAEGDETTNRYYAWAAEHNDPHFAASERGPELYEAFCTLFESDVGELTPEALVAACRKGKR